MNEKPEVTPELESKPSLKARVGHQRAPEPEPAPEPKAPSEQEE